jgi:hypothetical protein
MTSPISNFKSNVTEALKLLDIHEEVTGDKRGRRYNVEILNKSCIVLITACWEAFVEDIVSSALQHMITNCTAPHSFPPKLLKIIAEELKSEKHELRIFDLSGDGWRKIMVEHKDKMINKYIGSFNTPRFGNVDLLMQNTLGINDLSSCWQWKSMSYHNARSRLNDYITLRGAIAHRLRTAKAVTKTQAVDYTVLIIRIAVKTSNHIRKHVHNITATYPWEEIGFATTK